MTEEDHQDSDVERELSDSDSEPELDAVDYERRREHYFRQIILSEIQFNRLKLTLRDLKIKQLMKRRQDVINQIDPEFMVKHRELLDEFNARNRLTDAIRCLEMDSLERRTFGLKRIAETNQNDNKVLVQEKIRDQIMNEIRSEKERQVETKIVKTYFLGQPSDMKRECSESFDYPMKRARYNMPVVIHRLTDHQIDADIRSIELAVLIANMKREDDTKESLESCA